MIPPNLLKLTNFQALSLLVYGGPGLRKTFGVHTLPPPILLCDTEGGTSSLSPWIRKRRFYDQSSWTTFSPEDRQKAFDMLSEANRKWLEANTRITPGPYIDVVQFDPTLPGSWDYQVKTIADFDPSSYNSLAVDSLQEFSVETQTYSKSKKGVNVDEPMEVNYWASAQERAKIQLRKLKNLRNSGVFIYMTCSEMIDKEYVTDPREKGKGAQVELPYSIKGTANLPGQLAPSIQHFTDVMLRARKMGNDVVWMSEPEALPSGAQWEAKDRTGRLEGKFQSPNVRKILDQIYGEETRREIYACGKDLLFPS